MDGERRPYEPGRDLIDRQQLGDTEVVAADFTGTGHLDDVGDVVGVVPPPHAGAGERIVLERGRGRQKRQPVDDVVVEARDHAGHHAALGVAEQTDGGHVGAGAHVPKHGDEDFDHVEHVHVGEFAVTTPMTVEVEAEHGHTAGYETLGNPLIQAARIGVHTAAEPVAHDHDGARPVMAGAFKQGVQAQPVAGDGQFHVGPFR